MPEHRYIHLYRCLACGQYWTTTLRGDRILTGLDDDSMLFFVIVPGDATYRRADDVGAVRSGATTRRPSRSR